MIYYLKLFVITEESEESEDSEGTLFSSGSEGFRPRSNYSYVIVGDNLDENIRPRHMTSDHQTQSVHYFHCYAVQDRVDFHHLSNDEPMGDVSKLELSCFLPTVNESDNIRRNYAKLFGRILISKFPYFHKLFNDCVPAHISYKYSEEMGCKSNTVSVNIETLINT